jgi:hypothetical protein
MGDGLGLAVSAMPWAATQWIFLLAAANPQFGHVHIARPRRDLLDDARITVIPGDRAGGRLRRPDRQEDLRLPLGEQGAAPGGALAAGTFRTCQGETFLNQRHGPPVPDRPRACLAQARGREAGGSGGAGER